MLNPFPHSLTLESHNIFFHQLPPSSPSITVTSCEMEKSAADVNDNEQSSEARHQYQQVRNIC